MQLCMLDTDLLTQLRDQFDKEGTRLELLELMYFLGFISQTEEYPRCSESAKLSNFQSERSPSFLRDMIHSLRILVRTAERLENYLPPEEKLQESPMTLLKYDVDAKRRPRQRSVTDRLTELSEELRIERASNVSSTQADMARSIMEVGKSCIGDEASPSYIASLIVTQRKQIDRFTDNKREAFEQAAITAKTIEKQQDQITLLQVEVEKLALVRLERDRLLKKLGEVETLKMEKRELSRSLAAAQQNLVEMKNKADSLVYSQAYTLSQEHFRLNTEASDLKACIAGLEMENNQLHAKLYLYETSCGLQPQCLKDGPQEHTLTASDLFYFATPKNLKNLGLTSHENENTLDKSAKAEDCMEADLKNCRDAMKLERIDDSTMASYAKLRQPEAKADANCLDNTATKRSLKDYDILNTQFGQLAADFHKLKEAHIKLEERYQEAANDLMNKERLYSNLETKLLELIPENRGLNEHCETLLEIVKLQKTKIESLRRRKPVVFEGLELQEAKAAAEEIVELKQKIMQLDLQIQNLEAELVLLTSQNDRQADANARLRDALGCSATPRILR